MKNQCRFYDGIASAAARPLFRCAALTALAAFGLLAPVSARQDSSSPSPSGDPGAFQGADPQSGNPQSADADPNAANAQAGPVRMARFSYLEGDVTWRGGDDGAWSPGAQNFPLRQGAQLWVGDNSRAEIQFDDGSRLRLDHNTLVTLQTLYSDAQGEFTEITLNDGQLMLRLKNQFSQYQVNTTVASLKAGGPGRVRVGSGQGAQFAVTQGEATIQGNSGSATLGEGGYLDVVDANSPFRVSSMPGADAWDQWNNDRDNALDTPTNTTRYCPPNIALVADNLDSCGDWRSDPQYGHVWCPRDVPAGWRPYSNGQWTWVEPFGWTWVGAEPWGWAPYHYGTWVSTGYGWAWVPGPAVQYWSPGVVSFYQNNGVVAWCPLAPAEVHYPRTMVIGFRGGNWSALFSIGGTACYYPAAGSNYCVARPFSNHYVNRVTYVNNVTNVTNVYNTTVVQNVTVVHTTFVPANARYAGGTQVSLHDFGGHGAYQPIRGGTNNPLFLRTGLVTAPSGRGAAAFGPPNAIVTRLALTPSRTYVPVNHVPPAAIARPVFRAQLPGRIPPAAITTSPHFVRTLPQAQPTRPVTNGGAVDSRPSGFTHGNTVSRPAPTGSTGVSPTPTASGAVNRPSGGNPRFGVNPSNGSPANGSGTPTSGTGSSAPNRGSFGNRTGTPTNSASPTFASPSPRPQSSVFSNPGGRPRSTFGTQPSTTTTTTSGTNPQATPLPSRPQSSPFGSAGNTGGRSNPPFGTPAAGATVNTNGSPRPAGGNGSWGQRTNPVGGNGGSGAPGGAAAPNTPYRPLRDRPAPQQNKPDPNRKPAPTPTPAPAVPAKP